MRVRCLLAVMVVALTACGGGSSSSLATGSQDTASTTATSIDAATTSSGPVTTARATTTKPRPRVTLPAGGPKGPVDPPGTPAYQLLTSGVDGCQQLLTAVNRWPRSSTTDPSVNGVEDRLFFLYRAAAEACLQQWPQAKADFDRLQALKPAPTFATTCSSEDVRYCERCHRLVLDWLTSQLAAYRDDPAYAPMFATSSAPSPCPDTTTTTIRSTTSTTRAPATTTTTRR